ncbi:PHD finger protein 7-like [Meleagris gallopavo]|uniref:PHD finger protein 7-like n=1 Tax=Meleagris gallopavo TaxID=9103 RepID=UPI000549B974|nr:PHD finger protein 7-like [Meleagris gallopavo]
MGQRLCKWFPSIRTVCVETQEGTGSREPACVLCGRVDDDSSILGHKEEHSGVYFHMYCLKTANNLRLPGTDNNRARFYLEDLICAVGQAEQKLCFVCGKKGAFITCMEPGCDHSFHLPCASEGECITQYFGEFRSFCWEHRPQQAVEAVPAQDTTCVICMDPVGDSRSYSTMVCPSCQHAWFHRACVQEQALCAGIYCFQCPLCRDKDCFSTDMLTLGIRIPFRRPTWEDSDAYASLGARHQRCDASDCLNPHGRDWAEEEGPWELLLCSSCAAEGTHRRCSYLSHSTAEWECNTCVGEGIDSNTNLDSAGLSTITQQEPGPSRGSSTSSQAPSGSADCSRVPESSGRSSQRRMDRRRAHPHLHQDENTYNQPQGRRGSCRNAAPIAESSSLNSASRRTSESSRQPPELCCSRRCRQEQRARTRSRSPLERRAPDSPSQPKTCCGSRRAPIPSAESCTHSYTTLRAPQSSGDSTAADGSRPQQPRRARTRSRSPLDHRAAEIHSQPRRCHRSRSPGSEGHPRGEAAPRFHVRGPRTSTAGPNDAIETVM